MENKKNEIDFAEDLSPITEQQVWNVIEFAKHLNNMYPGIFNPDLVNARMKDINMNPLTGTKSDIQKALQDPKNSEEQLRGYNEHFEYTNMGYKRILGYYGNMLTFDYTYTCTNADPSDYSSKAYKKDLSILNDFLDKFNVKREFPKVMRSIIRNDAYFCVLREDGEQYILQELPAQYCKITGIWEHGYLFDFNMQYFLSNSGVDISMYPDAFKKYFKRVMDSKDNGYNPSQSIDARTGEWVYYVQTSPEDGMWAWKLNMEQAGRVPMFTPLFLDLLNTDNIRDMQYNKYIISAYRLLVGIIPRLKDQKGASVKDSLAISPETAGRFANLIKQGVPSAIGFGFAPFEEVKEFTFDGTNSNDNIYEDHLKTTISNSGTPLQSVFSTEKTNIEATRLAAASDEYFLTYLYPYFADFLNYHVNKRTRRFKFNFEFKGSHIPFLNDSKFEKVMGLANVGIVLPQEISACLHIQPKDFERQLRMAKNSDFSDLLMPLMSAYNSKQNEKGGRPESDGSNDNTAASQASGSNLTKGGKL